MALLSIGKYNYYNYVMTRGAQVIVDFKMVAYEKFQHALMSFYIDPFLALLNWLCLSLSRMDTCNASVVFACDLISIDIFICKIL